MKLARHFILVLAFVFVVVSSVHGQSGTTPGSRTRTDPVQRELQRRFESEALERALAKTPGRRAEHGQRMVVLQIQMDFLRIQSVNDDLQIASRAGLPDLKAVKKSASEITKCADRLKENLALPEIEKPEKPRDSTVEMKLGELRAALGVLSNVIDSFVENPVFEKLGVIDAELSLKARRDLEQIIQVSKQVKRSSEKLSRARAG
jgi:hypothetical protein